MDLKKKILVLGSTGMLGHQVVRYFKDADNYIISNLAYRYKLDESTIILNVFNGKALEEVIVKLNPDFIINCIGILLRSGQDEESYIYLNAYLPNQLKRIANSINAKLIHISSDCVFSGLKGEYIESDTRDGKGIYAETKKLGEIIDDTNLTLRTSMVGPELKKNGEGLFHWFMRNNEYTLYGFKNTIWSGVTTIELAKVIGWTIENHITGLHHITNNSPISKYDLLVLFQKYTKKVINIKSVDGEYTNKSFKNTKSLLSYEIPAYEKMIIEMADYINNNKTLYPHYKPYS
tara:strand:+ start:257 stop:1129 length:873 start_codon:yes stop_codon:yes gene_type:complete